jgi:hypothetical protein
MLLPLVFWIESENPSYDSDFYAGFHLLLIDIEGATGFRAGKITGFTPDNNCVIPPLINVPDELQ